MREFVHAKVPIHRAGISPSDAVPSRTDATELFNIEVDELARFLAFIAPGFGTAVDVNGKVWVTSTGSKTISLFDSDGKPLSPDDGYNFGGQLGVMQGIIVTPAEPMRPSFLISRWMSSPGFSRS